MVEVNPLYIFKKKRKKKLPLKMFIATVDVDAVAYGRAK